MSHRTLPPIDGLTAGDAAWLDAVASEKRAAAECSADPVWTAQQQAEAAGIEALAVRLRDPSAGGVPALRKGHGGETTPAACGDMPRSVRELAHVVQARPTMLAADASLDRLALARAAGVLSLAVETAQDAQAETAAERMLAHQLAAAHRLAMELLTLASAEAKKHRQAPHLNTGALAEAARTTTAAARLMDSFARGALALDRLRNGGRQVVTVQHVTVQDGGQAVVAGAILPRPASSGEGQP